MEIPENIITCHILEVLGCHKYHAFNLLQVLFSFFTQLMYHNLDYITQEIFRLQTYSAPYELFSVMVHDH